MTVGYESGLHRKVGVALLSASSLPTPSDHRSHRFSPRRRLRWSPEVQLTQSLATCSLRHPGGPETRTLSQFSSLIGSETTLPKATPTIAAHQRGTSGEREADTGYGRGSAGGRWSMSWCRRRRVDRSLDGRRRRSSRVGTTNFRPKAIEQ